MKRVFMAMILSYLLVIAVITADVFGVYYASRLHWLFGILVVVIGLLVLGAAIWYAIKFTSEFKGKRKKMAEYTAESYDAGIPEEEISENIKKRYSPDAYKHISGNDDGLSYEAYLKLNEASHDNNLFIIHGLGDKKTVDLDIAVNHIMMIHDVPPGLSETLIILIGEGKNPEEQDVIYLNGPHNIEDKKVFCAYLPKQKMVYYGAYTDLLYTGYLSRIREELMELFKLNKRD